ncbi:MAG: beta-propeller fold lactonase family protein [Terriglobales bacterium]
MSKKFGVALALVGMCALSLFLVNCGSSSSRPSGLLYVLTQGNNGVGNSISSFAIDLNNGGLSLINANASTCPTAVTDNSPNPCGFPVALLLDSTGNVAFVLDQGLASANVAPTIYSYGVNSDGSLNSPTSAATLPLGDIPIAMTLDSAGQFLYVLDVGPSPSATTCGVSPSTLCASILVFTAKPGSASLSAVAGSPLGRVPSALSVVTFTPPSGAVLPCATTTDFLYVTYNADPVYHNDNTLSAYCVDSTGTPNDLTPNAPYTTSIDPISVLAVNTNPAGTNSGGLFVYVGTQGPTVGAISAFQVCTQVTNSCTSENLAKLVPVGSPVTVGENAVAMLVDPTNNYLYAVSALSNQVYGFRVGTAAGTLTALTPPYQATGTQPVALAMRASVNSSGEFLYVANSNSSNISGWSVSTTSGALSGSITVISNPSPTSMAAK